MDSFISTPSSSDVDVLIEKFRVEISNDLNIDPDVRRLTISNTLKPHESASNHDLDKQISDLETLIKKLQDEINEMAKNADKDVEYTPIFEDSYNVHKDLSNETIILDNDSEDSESVRLKMKRDDTHTEVFDTDQFSHVYPLIIRDVILPTNKSFTKPSKSPNDENIMHPGGSFKQEMIHIWNDLPEYKTEDNFEGLICELQAEITEKMDTVKDVIFEETGKNSDTKLEDD